jgi:perosamine synthetase
MVRIGTVPTAIVAVHMLGHPCSMPVIVGLAETYGIPLIEDAAEAVGSSMFDPSHEMAWRPCGSWGQVSVLSFNLNKVVTSGGGGALLTNDDEIGSKAQHLATTARVAHPWLVEHDAVGWNHRMPMLSAALCSEQVKRLDVLVKAKRGLAMAYKTAVDCLDGVTFHDEPGGTFSNFWMPTILVPPGERDAVLTALHERGVMARAVFTPMHRLKMYQADGGAFPVADEMFARAICLPAGIELARRFA